MSYIPHNLVSAIEYIRELEKENKKLKEQISDTSWRESERRPRYDSWGQLISE